jgi:hypothetical protein
VFSVREFTIVSRMFLVTSLKYCSKVNSHPGSLCEWGTTIIFNFLSLVH